MGKFSKDQWKQKIQKQKEREKNSLSEAATDPRFQKALSDPKFKNVGTKKLRVKIDDRFKGMFKDPQFQITSKFDARGRKINRKDGEHLKKFYEVDDEEEEEEEEEQEEEEEDDEDIDDDEEQEEEEEEEDIDEDEYEEDVDEVQEDNEEFESDLLANTVQEAQLEADPVPIGDATYRLAVLNCDWDRLKAVDLFVLFSSFLPTDGVIKSVTVYPSEYGMEQMKNENLHGPEGIFKETVESEEDDKPKHVVRDEENDEDGFDEEKLREYELQRLKYYFAVVECDSVGTAQVLYGNTDGTEIESTANIMDVRYIPDDVTFAQPAREVSTSIPVHYKAPLFQTKILQHTKPDCSWDTTDSYRLSVTQANVTNENLHELEEQYKDYIASSSESESENDNDNANQDEIERKREKIRKKYKTLLDLIQPETKEGEEMEITFTPGIRDDTEDAESITKKGHAKNGKPSKKKDDSDEEDEPDSEYDHYDDLVSDDESKKPKKANHKKKKKKKLTAEEEKQQAELELMAIPDTLMAGGEAALDDKKKGYNLKTLVIQHSGSNRKKRKLKKLGKDQDDFTVDLKDQRFSALFDKPDFAVDPTDKRFKATKNADVILKERVKRRAEILMKPEQVKKNQNASNESNNNKNELSSLVESVKKKTQMVQQQKKKNQLPQNKKIKFED